MTSAGQRQGRQPGLGRPGAAGQSAQTRPRPLASQGLELLDEGASEALVGRQVPEDALVGDEGRLVAGLLRGGQEQQLVGQRVVDGDRLAVLVDALIAQRPGRPHRGPPTDRPTAGAAPAVMVIAAAPVAVVPVVNAATRMLRQTPKPRLQRTVRHKCLFPVE